MIRQLAFFISVVSIFFVGVASCFSQPAHVRIIPGSVKSGTFGVRKGSDKVAVESSELQVRIGLPSHTTTTLDVSMIYDSGTKLFWWRLDSVGAASVRQNPDTPALLPRNSLICLTDSKFVFFWNGWVSGGYILVSDSVEHYSSLDEGKAHLLRVLEDRRGDIDSGKFFDDYRQVEFQELNRDFLCANRSAFCIGPTLRDVRRVGDEWRIIEDGPNGGSALIVLNDKYEVIKTTLTPSK